MEELKDISLKKLAPEGVVSFVMGFVDHLNHMGFNVTGEAVSDIFIRCGSSEVRTAADLERVIKPHVVKSERQDKVYHNIYVKYAGFRDRIVVDKKTEEQLKRKISMLDALENERDSLNTKIEKSQAEYEAQEKALARSTISESEKKAISREYDKVKPGYQKVLTHVGDDELRLKLQNYAKGDYVPLTEKETKDMSQTLYDMLACAMVDKDYMELMRFMSNQIQRLYENGEHMADHVRELDNVKNELAEDGERLCDLQQSMEALTEQIETDVKIIEKDEALSHRDIFLDYGNAVWCDAVGDVAALDKKFFKLTEEEKHQIYTYIRNNAKMFRTRLIRSIQTNERQRIDIRQTYRKARETFGVPLKLCYSTKTRQRPRVILFLDISGSCADASELMLFFIHCMKGVFTGGCGAYVFVNKLYDISEFLEEPDPELAVRSVFENVPTKGAYSDYGEPFREFYENHMSEVGDNTFVFFIGDARGNRRDSGEAYVRAICAKARRSFWLCTERRNRWNKCDSVLDTYAKYMNRVGEVLTTNQLLDFLMNI